MDSVRTLAREVAERELRWRLFEARWTGGGPAELAKAWQHAEHDRIVRWIPRSRALSLRHKLMVIERSGTLLARREQLYQSSKKTVQKAP
jgi:hypothetical protein